MTPKTSEPEVIVQKSPIVSLQKTPSPTNQTEINVEKPANLVESQVVEEKSEEIEPKETLLEPKVVEEKETPPEPQVVEERTPEIQKEKSPSEAIEMEIESDQELPKNDDIVIDKSRISAPESSKNIPIKLIFSQNLVRIEIILLSQSLHSIYL